MDNNRFIVFDIEAPNAANDRISAIGILVLEQGKIKKQLYTLVNPETHFDAFNIQLTGIRPEAVENKPTFDQLWPMIEPVMSSGILVAHNAPFDMSVIAKCLHSYNIEWKTYVPYLCTCQTARSCLPGLPNYKLNTLCDELSIPLYHHNAASDCRACAEVLLHCFKTGQDVMTYSRIYNIERIKSVPRNKQMQFMQNMQSIT